MNTWIVNKQLQQRLTKKFLILHYIKEKQSCDIIAKNYKCSRGTILKYLRKYNIPIRNRSEAQIVSQCKKIKNPVKSDDGYNYIYVPYHPHKTARKYVFEHRLKIEAKLNKISFKKWVGFGKNGNYPKYSIFLSKQTVVHHLNGKTRDNRIQNLMLFPNLSAHQAFKHLGKAKFICKFCNKDQRKDYQ